MQLEGKKIIVTGGANGVAEATVRRFAEEGANVVSLDIQDESGERVAREATAAGPGTVAYMHCDITQQDEVNRVFDAATQLLGGLDVLAAIAGTEAVKPAEDLTGEDIDKMIGVHLKHTVFTNAAAFRTMKDKGGSIINYGSHVAITGHFLDMSAYGAAKGAVQAWTRNVAREWAEYNIRVNAVGPAVWTPLAKRMFAELDTDTKQAFTDYFAWNVPLGGDLGDPLEPAKLNVFLASDNATFITGQMLQVDGGQVFAR
ncbi:SDR family NAD(P)-dependent oxidoreductase [Frondihabitans cladoniiphilus]|uniref:SDR family oxidoreductase n=1 Tax=Frondihabitans cladoniiphilus TaxID=715785 RepID=A0ABP8VTX2_9MICO